MRLSKPLTPRALARCPLPQGEREKPHAHLTSPLAGEVASGSERVRGSHESRPQ
jgi:hypothetical protein